MWSMDPFFFRSARRVQGKREGATSGPPRRSSQGDDLASHSRSGRMLDCQVLVGLLINVHPVLTIIWLLDEKAPQVVKGIICPFL